MDKNYTSVFAKNVAKEMKMQKMTQLCLGNKTNLSISYINRFLNSDRGIALHNSIAISEALGVNLSILCGLNNAFADTDNFDELIMLSEIRIDGRVISDKTKELLMKIYDMAISSKYDSESVVKSAFELVETVKLLQKSLN